MPRSNHGILLVFSDPMFAAAVIEILRLSCHARLAAGLGEARALLAEHRFDLVLTAAVCDDGVAHQLQPALDTTPWAVLGVEESGQEEQRRAAAQAVAAGARGYLALAADDLKPNSIRAWISVLLPAADHRRPGDCWIAGQHAELLDQVSDAIIISTLDDRVVYWNRGAQNLYGWKAEEVAGREISELIANDDSQAYHKALVRVLESGEWAGELRQTCRRGDDLVVASRWTLESDGMGEPCSILRFNSDITEKKQLEARVLRTQRLESLGTLAGGVAHDLNNVLTPIMLSLGLLHDEIQSARRKTLVTLEASVMRAMGMVKQLMWFARGVEGERTEFDLRAVAADLERVIRETYPPRIEIISDYSVSGATLEGDPAQLFQVLMNLCANARDAITGKGRIALSVSGVRIDRHYAAMRSEAREGDYLLLTVSDTGTGIGEAELEQIFDPFFSTKGPVAGTGMGLTTVRSIVHGHGGFVDVSSQPGEGTTVRVFLPARQPATLLPASNRPPCWGEGRQLLLAEDDPVVREITRETLEQQGYRVIAAGDGAEAVALYAKHRRLIDAVVTDISMPFLDGKEAIRALRQLDPAVRVLAISGLAENLVDLHSPGSCIVLEKPFTAEVLFAKLDELLAITD